MDCKILHFLWCPLEAGTESQTDSDRATLKCPACFLWHISSHLHTLVWFPRLFNPVCGLSILGSILNMWGKSDLILSHKHKPGFLLSWSHFLCLTLQGKGWSAHALNTGLWIQHWSCSYRKSLPDKTARQPLCAVQCVFSCVCLVKASHVCITTFTPCVSMFGFISLRSLCVHVCICVCICHVYLCLHVILCIIVHSNSMKMVGNCREQRCGVEVTCVSVMF